MKGIRLAFAGAKPLLQALVLFAVLSPFSASTSDSGLAPWLLVDTVELTLTVIGGGQPLLALHNIAIGRYGVSAEKRRGDNTTPLGLFRVSRIRRDSDFHRFISLDYPDIERAEKGAREGVISESELQQIQTAHRRRVPPPQGTALGGHIGIHGLGRGDPGLHRSMNWTRGCVALTDRQVDALLAWVRVGMAVEIR